MDFLDLKKSIRQDNRAAKIKYGTGHQHENHTFCSLIDFMLRCLNKTAPYVLRDYFEKVDHTKAIRFNGHNLKLSKVKAKSAKRKRALRSGVMH